MYQIVTSNGVVCYCDAPNYIRYKARSGAWISTTEDKAEGIAVLGEIYNIASKPPIRDAPIAHIKKCDGMAILFDVSRKVNDNADKTATLQEVACDFYSDIDNVKEALCDLCEEVMDNG